MKDLLVFRSVILMVLLLASMYFVFSTVIDRMGVEEEEENEEETDLTSLLEDFEVIAPHSDPAPTTSGNRISDLQQGQSGNISSILESKFKRIKILQTESMPRLL